MMADHERPLTIADIEAQVADLARDTAGRKGMKLGDWISARLKAAAIKGLARRRG